MNKDRSGPRAAVVLAAGLGKRMKSGLPKVLHQVCGDQFAHRLAEEERLVRLHPPLLRDCYLIRKDEVLRDDRPVIVEPFLDDQAERLSRRGEA